MNEFEYKIVFLNEDGTMIDYEIATFPAEDEDEAWMDASDWADDQLEVYDAFEWEINLVDCH